MDGPFKGMSPDPDSLRIERSEDKSYVCEECGGRVYIGDWPSCEKAGEKGHAR